MKYPLAILLTTCLSTHCMAKTSADQALPAQIFKSQADAAKHCPATDSLTFKPGQPAPGKLGKFSYITATFSGKKDGITFMNSVDNACCPAGTPNPQTFLKQDDIDKIRKAGSTPCLVMPAPMILAGKDVLQKVRYYRNDAGNYGYSDGRYVTCNYQYTGSMKEPGTTKAMSGIVALISQ